MDIFINTFIRNNCFSLLQTKGTEYSRGEEDVNSNFKRLSEELGIESKQVLYIYLKKHLDAISYYIKTNEVKSEPIEGRIADAINYLLILASLISEEQENAYKTIQSNRQEQSDGSVLTEYQRIQCPECKLWSDAGYPKVHAKDCSGGILGIRQCHEEPPKYLERDLSGS